MSTQATQTTPQKGQPNRLNRAISRLRNILPGLLVCLGVAAVAWVVNLGLPGVSPLIIAIVLGILTANLVRLPAVTAAGIDFSAKKLLRLGIVFLGLKLVLADILGLGAPMLVVVVCIVAGGVFGTLLLGKLFDVRPGLSLLIACGFSICGAAAVAGAAGVVDPDDEAEEDTVTAVALVVLFGTLMIPLIPLIATLTHLAPESAGMLAGASIHEIAQVVAAGGIIGGGALAVAVVVKLARVLMLAPIVATLSVQQRRKQRQAQDMHAEVGTELQGSGVTAKLPPIVPLFIIGFIAMVALRSAVDLPQAVLATGEILQTVLLSAAMFGLGCGVKVKKLVAVGAKPFLLAACATVLVVAIAFVGIIVAA